jgi:hypothetical protein
MTLEDFMVQRGFLSRGHKKCYCPMHADVHESAMFNINAVYCFACSRSYSYVDIGKRFGVFLQRINDKSELVSTLSGESEIQPEVLFQYKFQVSDLPPFRG